MLQTTAPTETTPPASSGPGVDVALATARRLQGGWAGQDIRQRLTPIASCRRDLVDNPRAWAEPITNLGQRTVADSLAAEVLPTADACRFLERNAERILRDTKPSASDRPIWGRGLRVRIKRQPLGVVLVIGAGNYPLFLAGVQTLQAVVAGNAVLIKPPPGGAEPMQRLARVLQQGGMPAGLVQVLDPSPAAAQQAIEAGVDRVVLTGSAATGRKVLAQAAESLTPCTMELSGCDAVFVLPDADLERVAAAIDFGLRLNGSATCIGPRRLFVPHDLAKPLTEKLLAHLPAIPPTTVPPAVAEQAEQLVSEALAAGAEPLGESPQFGPDRFAPIVLKTPTVDIPLLRADLFASVLSIVEVDDANEALRLSRQCPYALGASVFGPIGDAEQFATQVEAGFVSVNDLVAPSADPRVAFGGWNESGFGVTRGAEGLLEMTRPQTIVTQHARWLPHLDPPFAGLDRLLIGLLRMSHGRSLAQRWQGLRSVIAASKDRKTK